jgi:hypothetical protein
MAYARTTVGTVRELLKERLGGQATFYTETEQTQALNEALAVWQLLTGEYTTEYAQQIAAGSNVVQLDTASATPVGIIRIRAASGTATTGNALEPMSIFEMDHEFYQRAAYTSGTPEYWAPMGYDAFVVHPPASTTQTVGVMYLTGDSRLNTDPAGYIDLGDEEIQSLIEYAHWYLTFKEGLTEAFENSSPLRALFLLAARQRNQKLRNSAPYRDYMAMQRDEHEPAREIKEQEGLRK